MDNCIIKKKKETKSYISKIGLERVANILSLVMSTVAEK